eukprot:CAMPEP_0196781634 /NCGR_PEP_ID=MMETSP1104-20130614/10011_1 /TAXON_ID=33652 /ORGANISM="Cafeteria sp., Strain Caron Lab Isolate" /LENGTH=754 /DNA_ID=CAMNT_0042151867 /DNA_START=46 /DNA_END=2310 /DNA_ORIENTATION=+
MGKCCSCCRGSNRVKSAEEAYQELLPLNQPRKCRDVLCILIFMAFWLGMIIVASIAFTDGNAFRLLYGKDFKGNICGHDSGVSSLDKVAYPRLTEDLLAARDRFGSLSGAIDNINKINFFGICVSSCPDAGDYLCSYDAQAEVNTRIAATGNTNTFNQEVSACKDRGYDDSRATCALIYDECWLFTLKTTSYLLRCLPLTESDSTSTSRCLDPTTVSADSSQCRVKETNTTTTTTGTAQQNVLFDQITSFVNTWANYFGDLTRTWYIILTVGLVGALVLSFVFAFLLRLFVKCIVWTIILSVFLACVLGTFLLYIKAGIISSSIVEDFNQQIGSSSSFTLPEASAEQNNNQDLFKWLSYLMTAVTLIVLIVIVSIRERVNIACTVIQEAGKALNAMPLLTLWPLHTVLWVTILFLYYIFVAATLYSMGDFKTDNTTSVLDEGAGSSNASDILDAVQRLEYKSAGMYLQLYHFFGLLWTNQVIQGVGMCVIAGAVVRWYWVRDKKEMAKRPIWEAYKTTLRYHFGSIIFGGLVIAIIQFIRAIMAYIDHKTRKIQAKNCLFKVIMKCIHCCLWCFEKIIKFVSRQAYIMIAMYGKSFCSSTMSAVKLILANLARVSVLNFLSFFIMILGKVMVTASAAVVAYFWLTLDKSFQESGSNALNSIWLPLAVTALAAFAIASSFFYVYDVAVDTIMLCFLKDEEIHKAHTNKAMFNHRLAKVVGMGRQGKGAAAEEDEEEVKDTAGKDATAGGNAVELM